MDYPTYLNLSDLGKEYNDLDFDVFKGDWAIYWGDETTIDIYDCVFDCLVL